MGYFLNQQEIIQNKLRHPAGSFQRFEKNEIEQSIPERFEKQVEKYSDRIAISDGERKITYEQFNKDANRIARSILELRGGNSEPIALLLEHGFHSIVGIYGVLKAGKFYIPLEPSYPYARIAYMLEDSQAQLIVTDSKNLDMAKQLSGGSTQIIFIDEIKPEVSDENPGISISPDSLAYIIYTSGSTGRPKGVFNNHRNLLHIVMRCTNEMSICPDDRFSFIRSYSFNGALKDIYCSLLNGASIHPFDLKEQGFMGLAEWLIREEVTIYISVVTSFRQMVSILTGNERFPNLRLIYVGGEMVTKRDFELYKKYMKDAGIFSCGLGTSETSSAAHFFSDRDSEIEGSVMPIGYSLEDTEVFIVDENHKRLDPDKIGEIAIKSKYNALGYWRKPEETKKAFLPEAEGGSTYLTGDLGVMTPDGCLIHKGRKDQQVKVRGHRIETAEIEMALTSMENIKDSVVIVREDKHGYQRLIAYVIPHKQPAPNVSEIRRFLLQKLPDYMIPSAFVFMESFPVAHSTKLDYRSLPDPPKTRPELENIFVPPKMPLEERLAEIWSQFLSLDEIGIHDNFFDLGGHSLMATQVISKISNEFDVEMPLKSFFETPTLKELALFIAQNRAENDDIQKLLSELEAISDDEARKIFTKERESR